MKRQRLEVMCPGVILHYRKLVREQTHAEASQKQFQSVKNSQVKQ